MPEPDGFVGSTALYTILVVDDSKNIREFCRRELEKCAYRVLVAQDGREALDVCDSDAPDLIVLDVRMPGLDGPETVRQLLKRNSTTPVVFHTSHRLDPRLDHCDWPTRACVEKSQDLGELKSAIARTLTEAEQARKSS
jgi:CheY-like chemotaxis protein